MKLSKKYHPDKNKDPRSADIFTDINDAYQTLLDPNKRRVYDLYGEPGVHLYESPSEGAFDPMVSLTKSANSNSDKVKHRGATVKITFPFKLESFYTGQAIELNVSRTNMCRCPSAGFYCNKCKGNSVLREHKIIKSYLERGFEEGQIVSLKGVADVSEENGAGDIDVECVSKPHPIYTRHGHDLHMTVNITLREALLGFTRTVKGIDGQPLEITSNKPFSDPIVIKSRGLPKYMYPGVFGDVIVDRYIRWPKHLDLDQIKQIKQILKL
ncbi:DnaJ domain containing protein [Trichomonas vaginalis G3]|uniref:DnaJ domain containing protein n=1 Tax=Trichomonas vaginalis (strain ATCC PRA-98 / G3) TaxID=412133 RepID=A2F9F6_TRIV3|nr:heat shock protein binding [Trichomonas vaginalis G3]EAX98475.1 DnaJ domain containing protein [Trichomonas vaginalis G3]KAI5492759.1 heat shock protein binding [Trichomonas vaginalis G3]|eukprot:XP_001311405.1 DnaJ domain containing protein [Trichomonas vaginalis G3]